MSAGVESSIGAAGSGGSSRYIGTAPTGSGARPGVDTSGSPDRMKPRDQEARTVTPAQLGRHTKTPRRRRLPQFLRVLTPAPRLDALRLRPDQRSQVFMAASLLLDYPSDEWPQILHSVDTVAVQLPPPIARELQSFCSWATLTSQRAVEELYVETFDYKRRCSLEMTYYATGDTRQRGIALSVFHDLYAATGWQHTSGQLPDYLPSVLELAAKSHGESLQLVDDIIASHREGIEILHASLLSLDSPWAKVVAALRMVLPDVDDATRQRMQNLIRQGPPAELVGITDLPWPHTTSDTNTANTLDNTNTSSDDHNANTAGKEREQS